MRVTNKMMSNNFLADMKVNLENINKIQQQNTSGKKFRRPSDDPFAVARSMQLHYDINTNKQYSKDITDVSNWLDTTDTALGQAGNVLHRVRELLVSAGNGGYTDAERRAIKDEINEKVAEMSQILNTSFAGNYIFGGTRSTTKPMSVKNGVDFSKAAGTGEIIIDKTGKSGTIVDNTGVLNKDVKIDINFGSTKKSITLQNKKVSVANLSDLAKEINEKIDSDTDLKGKVKAIPNEADKKIMFINIDKSITDMKIKSAELGMSTEVEAKYSAPSNNNTKLIYNKKGGGELDITKDDEYKQIQSKLKIQVAQGVTMEYNVSANNIIDFTKKDGTATDLIKVFNNITEHLDNNDNEVIKGDLQDITDAMDNLLKVRSEVGAKQNRIDGADDRNKDGTFNMTQILSKHEDVNYTQNMTDYATMLTVYMASLQTSAKIIQPSLMDYLR